MGGRREALGVLLRRYVPALRAHLVVQKRVPRDAAADLIQGFVCDKVVEQGLLAGADRCKGKFRSFLRTALDRAGIATRLDEPDVVLALDSSPEAVGRLVAGAGLVVYELRLVGGSLEDAFLSLTSDTEVPR